MTSQVLSKDALDAVLPPIDRTQLEESAYNAIKVAILTLRLAPGTSLVETSLAKQLGISKTPVRAALTKLKKEALVESVPHKGWWVARLTLADVEEIFEARTLVQGYCAFRLAESITPMQVEELRQCIRATEVALAGGNRSEATDTLGEFDAYISSFLPNEHLRSFLKNLRERLRLIGAVSRQIPDRVEKSIAEHRLILQALEGRDAPQARQLMQEHIGSVRQDFVTAMKLMEWA